MSDTPPRHPDFRHRTSPRRVRLRDRGGPVWRTCNAVLTVVLAVFEPVIDLALLPIGVVLLVIAGGAGVSVARALPGAGGQVLGWLLGAVGVALVFALLWVVKRRMED